MFLNINDVIPLDSQMLLSSLPVFDYFGGKAKREHYE